MCSILFLILAVCGGAVLVKSSSSNIYWYPTPKICTCGLKYAGPLVQPVTSRFKFIDGAYWDKKANAMFFVDRHGATSDRYETLTGAITVLHVKEFEGQEVSSLYPVENGIHQYVAAANNTIYLIKVKPEEDGSFSYTLIEIMKVMNNSQLFTVSTTTHDGKLIIGTKPANYDDVPNIKKGTAQFFKVDLTSKQKSVVEGGFTLPSGVTYNKYYTKIYFADAVERKIWEYDITLNGKTSNKKLVFDLDKFKDTITGKISGIVADTEGRLWIGMLMSNQILVFDIYKNKIVQKIGVPASAVNTMAWGGMNYDILFAGTTYLFPVSDPKMEPEAGKFLAISGTGSKGWAYSRVHV